MKLKLWEIPKSIISFVKEEVNNFLELDAFIEKQTSRPKIMSVISTWFFFILFTLKLILGFPWFFVLIGFGLMIGCRYNYFISTGKFRKKEREYLELKIGGK